MQLFYHQLYHQSRKLSHRLPRHPSCHSIHRPPLRSPLLSLLLLSPLAIIGTLAPTPTSALTLEDDRAFSVSVDYSMGIVLSSTNLTIPIYPTDTGQFGRTSTSVYVDTNNIAGYTLTLQSNTDKLTNTKLGTTIDPLDSPLSCTIESDDTCDTFPTNQWGYRIGATGSYLPATDIVNKPIELAHTDTVTMTTDPVATLYFGTKIDTHLPTGIYDGVELTFIATANIQKYNVTLLPTAGITSITLDDESPCTDTTKGCVYALEKDSEHTIKAITSEGYSFDSWHNSSAYGSFANINSAETIFTVGEDDVELTASATVNSYTCAKQYRLQSADGTYPATYTGAGTETITYGETCSYTQSYDNYQTQSTSGTMTTSGLTLSLDLPRNTYTLTMAKDANISSTTPATGTSTRRWGEVINISATAASGKKFKNWTASAGSIASSTSASTTFTMPVGNATVTANGATAGLQDLTSCDGVTSAADNRDGQSYRVAILADGKCWMLDNLNLGGADLLVSQLDNSNTNFSGTVAKATFNNWIVSTSSGNINGYTTPNIIKQTGSDNNGSYNALYNYCAASMNTYCLASNTSTNSDTNGSRAISGDICPKGWRLPTGGSNGEWQALRNAYSSDSAFITALKLPLSGNFGTGAPDYQGSVGNWWSSSRYNAAVMYRLALDGSTVYPAINTDRYFGFSLRCVLGS